MSVLTSVPRLKSAEHFEDWSRARNSGATWHLLYVKSRQEKLLSGDLSAMGIAHFLPLAERTRYYGKRKNTVELPIFPGYLFVLGALDDAYRADRTGRVVHIIRVPNQYVLHWELTNLRYALMRETDLETYPFLKEGIRVEVRSGPFRGLQGIVESRSNSDRLILQVEMLARAVSLEIDGALLDVIE